MEAEVKIFIADDHPVFRQGLRQTVERDPFLKVVGEAADGATAVDQIQHTAADIAVVDVDMPNGDGFEVLRALKQRNSPVSIIFLTMHKDERLLNASLDLGVKGYLLKDSAETEIITGIKEVAAGREYVSQALIGYLINRGRRVKRLLMDKPAVARLTPTERKILALLAEYKTSKEIAQELFISPRTVDHHRANISEKLDLHGSHALIRFASEHRSEL